jgi:F-type H+-transporting ATPase subunit b
MAGDATHSETQVANADHGGGFPPFDPSTYGSQLIWLAITFGVLYVMIARVVAPRIGGILEVRQDRIESDKAEAMRLKDETDQAIAAYEQSLSEARQKAHGIAQLARDEAKSATDAERAELESALTEKLVEAESKVAALKTQALTEVDSIAKDITSSLIEALGGASASDDQVNAAVKSVS